VLSCAAGDDRAVLDDAAESLVGLLRRPQAAEGIRHFMAKTPPPWAKE
jgi:isohexenylglutaconyl-CoA hydratase